MLCCCWGTPLFGFIRPPEKRLADPGMAEWKSAWTGGRTDTFCQSKWNISSLGHLALQRSLILLWNLLVSEAKTFFGAAKMCLHVVAISVGQWKCFQKHKPFIYLRLFSSIKLNKCKLGKPLWTLISNQHFVMAKGAFFKCAGKAVKGEDKWDPLNTPRWASKTLSND